MFKNSSLKVDDAYTAVSNVLSSTQQNHALEYAFEQRIRTSANLFKLGVCTCSKP